MSMTEFTTILDKIVWQKLVCFLIFRHIVICLLYLILGNACPSPYINVAIFGKVLA